MFHWTSLTVSALPLPVGAEAAVLKSLDLISPGLGKFIACTEVLRLAGRCIGASFPKRKDTACIMPSQMQNAID